MQCVLLSKKEGYQATALPYGINTPGSFAVLFGILTPVKLAAGCPGSAFSPYTPIDSADAAAVYTCHAVAAENAWAVGVATNVLVGIISVALGFLGPQIRKVTPPVALLTSLAGIGIAFLGIGQVTKVFAEPIVGVLPLYLCLTLYFGDVNTGIVPKSLIVVVVGTILGWADGVQTGDQLSDAADQVKWYGLSSGGSAITDWSDVGDYLGTVIPVAIAAAAGTLMNVYSAEQAGDSYGVGLTMVSDGVGTMIAALFGCPFSTSVYIGHPAYKKMGAGAMYSVFNAIVLFIIGLTGMFALIIAIVPPQAVAPLLLFVGLLIFSEAVVSATPREYPLVGLGIMPSIVDWASNAGINTGRSGDLDYYGYVAMAKSALLLALVTTSILAFGVNRKFLPAAIWSLVGAFLAAFGLLHQAGATTKDWTDPVGEFEYCDNPLARDNGTAIECSESSGPRFAGCLQFGFDACGWYPTTAPRFMGGYLLVAAMFAGFHVLQQKGKIDEPVDDNEPAEIVKMSGADKPADV